MNNLSVFQKAVQYAKRKHEGQKRDDGGDVFQTHLRVVVNILRVVTNDIDILSAAVLHDVLEDTETSYAELENEFGKEIATLVLMLTKKENNIFPFLKQSEEKNDLFQKACLIKFADRLSNISDMSVWEEEKQKCYLKKSMFWKTE